MQNYQASLTPNAKPTNRQKNHRLFVMPKQSPERVKVIAVLINVRHTASQARLQLLGVVSEDQHHHSLRERRERRPGILINDSMERFGRHEWESVAWLHSDTGECEHHSRKDVDDDLLVDR